MEKPTQETNATDSLQGDSQKSRSFLWGKKPKLSKEEKAKQRAENKALRKEKRKGLRVYRRSIRKQYRSIQRRSIRFYLWWTFKLSVLLFVVAGVIGGTYLYNKYGDMVIGAYEDSKERTANLDMGVFTDREPTIIKDAEGNVLRELSAHPFEYIEIDNIQDSIKLATIAIEDERYLEHDGVDFKALTRAAYYLVKNSGAITQGGSTITQQLVKNNLLTMEQTYSRKLTEVFIAFELEKRITKKQILEYYLNNIYFGNGAYGIESASNYYFSKPSKDLTLAEATFLMAIPNNPSVYDPIKKPENTSKRQSRILQKMYEQNFITHDEFTNASLAKISLNINERIYEPESYLVSYAISDATKKLMKVNGFEFKYDFSSDEEREKYNEKYNEVFTQANEDIRNGGYIIETSLNQELQNTLQNSINSAMSYSRSKDPKTGLYKRQAASTIIDNETGLVKAIVGGRTQDDVANTYNRAYLAHRQPGSIIKPVLVYTPAIQDKGYTATTTVIDEAIKKGPKNVTNSYIGATTVENAVVQSINTIPYKIIQQLGVDNALKYLTDMNFSRIVDSDHNATSSIGGMTYGTTTLEMASAYSTIERNGQFIEPSSILVIKNASNEQIIYEHEAERKQVYDAGASEIMRGILEKTAHNSSAVTGLDGKLEGYATGAKTGTTNATKDVWYAGFTPYYTMVVWVGEDTPVQMRNKTSYEDPLTIWHDAMVKAHKGLPSKTSFDKVEGATMLAWVNRRNGRISPYERSGWSRAYIPSSRYTQQQADDKKREEERLIKQEEEERIKAIENERKKIIAKRKEKEAEDARKELNALLKGYGTTLAEEDEKAKTIEYRLSILTNYRFYNRSNFAIADQYIVDVQDAINTLKYIEYKERYQEELDEQISRVDRQKDLIERDVIQAKHEAEMSKLRQEEAKIKEQERQRLQSQLDAQREAERKRLEEEKAKQDRLDAENDKQQQEQQNQNNNSNQQENQPQDVPNGNNGNNSNNSGNGVEDTQ